MFIRNVDESLERFIRERLALSDDLGDVTFEAPTSNWSAQLSRITVNLFLYDVGLCESALAYGAAPGRRGRQGAATSAATDGAVGISRQRMGRQPARRAPTARRSRQPVRREAVVPAEHMVGTCLLESRSAWWPTTLNRPRDVFSGSGGQLKAAFALEATVAADSYDWTPKRPLSTELPPSRTRFRGRRRLVADDRRSVPEGARFVR